ncbi:hypothetical protein B0H15DRAFT_1018366 [Mycena belliarum]|uniref:Uncharacterized protein n=1 Tax=Mycena belliarum TaxID=1033014 RepID=A0AAD6UIG9_9AGAR|nr:hypothetical protein B0H15DRAFT_1018363 [Mycena belliae]KAJ7100055.1 hypothetical protein B0H15DRAFT_1018366 [Mycena belliae]
MSPVPVTARQRPCASGPVAFLAPASSSAFGSIFGLPTSGLMQMRAPISGSRASATHQSFIISRTSTLCYASRARDMALESLPVPEPAPEFRLDFWASREQREMSGALPRVSSAHRAHRALPFLTRFSSFPRPVPPLRRAEKQVQPPMRRRGLPILIRYFALPPPSRFDADVPPPRYSGPIFRVPVAALMRATSRFAFFVFPLLARCVRAVLGIQTRFSAMFPPPGMRLMRRRGPPIFIQYFALPRPSRFDARHP